MKTEANMIFSCSINKGDYWKLMRFLYEFFVWLATIFFGRFAGASPPILRPG